MTQYADTITAEVERLEHEALRLVDSGHTVLQAADRTGLGEPHITALIVRRQPCGQSNCGVPHGVGRPRKGWINLRRSGISLWFCSFRCISRWCGTHQ